MSSSHRIPTAEKFPPDEIRTSFEIDAIGTTVAMLPGYPTREHGYNVVASEAEGSRTASSSNTTSKRCVPATWDLSNGDFKTDLQLFVHRTRSH
eukprot:106949-Rhodomonas_salina.1